MKKKKACPQGARARCAVCNCLFLMEAYALWPVSYSRVQNPRPVFLEGTMIAMLRQMESATFGWRYVGIG